MFDRLNKVLLGATLVGEIMCGNCFGSEIPLLQSDSQQKYTLKEISKLLIRSDKDLKKNIEQFGTFIKVANTSELSNISEEYCWLLEDLKYGWLGNDYKGALQSDKERTIKYLLDSLSLLQSPHNSTEFE